MNEFATKRSNWDKSHNILLFTPRHNVGVIVSDSARKSE